MRNYFLIGGNRNSEIISLSSETCYDKISNFNLHSHIFGSFLGKKPFVCSYTKCYSYSFEESKWNLLGSYSLSSPIGGAIDENRYWLYDFKSSKKSFIYVDGKGFTEGPSLNNLQPMYRPCMVKLNDHQFFFVGNLNWGFTSATYLYDMNSNSWTRLANLNARSYENTCGRVIKSNGEVEIVSLQGSRGRNTFIYSFKTGSWRTARNTYPYRSGTWYANTMPYDNTLIAANMGSDRNIYRYEPFNETWIPIGQVQNTRMGAAMFAVPDC